MKLQLLLRTGFSLLPILFLSTNCTKADTASINTIDKALEVIYLAHYGLDYPGNEATLDNCRKKAAFQLFRIV